MLTCDNAHDLALHLDSLQCGRIGTDNLNVECEGATEAVEHIMSVLDSVCCSSLRLGMVFDAMDLWHNVEWPSCGEGLSRRFDRMELVLAAPWEVLPGILQMIGHQVKYDEKRTVDGRISFVDTARGNLNFVYIAYNTVEDEDEDLPALTVRCECRHCKEQRNSTAVDVVSAAGA